MAPVRMGSVSVLLMMNDISLTEATLLKARPFSSVGVDPPFVPGVEEPTTPNPGVVKALNLNFQVKKVGASDSS